MQPTQLLSEVSKVRCMGVENIELLDQARVALYNSFSDSYLFLSA